MMTALHTDIQKATQRRPGYSSICSELSELGRACAAIYQLNPHWITFPFTVCKAVLTAA